MALAPVSQEARPLTQESHRIGSLQVTGHIQIRLGTVTPAPPNHVAAISHLPAALPRASAAAVSEASF